MKAFTYCKLSKNERIFLKHVLESWSPAAGPERITKAEQRLTDSILIRLRLAEEAARMATIMEGMDDD
jgi:hypothetical protein